MQIIQCDKCGKYFKLPSDATDRLDRVIKAGSGSIYLKCPYCNEKTPFNHFTAIFEDTTLLNKVVDSKQNDILHGLLPKQYEQCIENEGHFILIKGDKYMLYSINELFKTINIDGNSYLQIYQLKGFSKTLEGISEISTKEKEILDNAISIGEGNGAILFIKNNDEKHSIYVFYLDGGYIEPLKITLDSILSKLS